MSTDIFATSYSIGDLVDENPKPSKRRESIVCLMFKMLTRVLGRVETESKTSSSPLFIPSSHPAPSLRAGTLEEDSEGKGEGKGGELQSLSITVN